MNYYIIDQINPHTGEFDEHKIVAGANLDTVDAALAYLSNYEPNWQGLGAISEVTPHIFDLWLKHGNRKAPFSNSDFAEKPLHLALVGDAAPDPSKSRHWITTEHGSHILINGNGDVVAGAGGELKDKKFSVPAGSKDVSKHIETVEKIAQAGYEKHGGEKAEYLRAGWGKKEGDTKKSREWSSAAFAREYEKDGTLPSDVQIQQDDSDWHKLKHDDKVKTLVDKLGMSKKEAEKMANYAITSPFRDKNTHLDDALTGDIPEGHLRDVVKPQESEEVIAIKQAIAKYGINNENTIELTSPYARKYGREALSKLVKEAATEGLFEEKPPELVKAEQEKSASIKVINERISAIEKTLKNNPKTYRRGDLEFEKRQLLKDRLAIIDPEKSKKNQEIREQLLKELDAKFGHTQPQPTQPPAPQAQEADTKQGEMAEYDKYMRDFYDYGSINKAKTKDEYQSLSAAQNQAHLSNALRDLKLKNKANHVSIITKEKNGTFSLRNHFSFKEKVYKTFEGAKKAADSYILEIREGNKIKDILKAKGGMFAKDFEPYAEWGFSQTEPPNPALSGLKALAEEYGDKEAVSESVTGEKPKKLSITRTPSLSTVFEHASKGWNAEKLSDDDLARALMYNRAAQSMQSTKDIAAKVPSNQRYKIGQSASKDLENKILAEYKKRGLDNKYEFDVNVLPK